MTLSAIFVNRLVVVVYQIVQKEQKVFKSIERSERMSTKTTQMAEIR